MLEKLLKQPSWGRKGQKISWLMTIQIANLARYAFSQSWPCVFKILNSSQNKEELINRVDMNGRNLLYYALISPKEDWAMMLLKMKADVNSIYNFKNMAKKNIYERSRPKISQNSAVQMSCLHLAVIENKLQVVKFLAQNHPHLLSVKDSKQETPMMTACKLNNIEAMDLLLTLSTQQDLDIRNGQGESVFDMLCQNSFSNLEQEKKRVNFLLSIAFAYPDINVDVPNIKGDTPLMILCDNAFEYPKGMLFYNERKTKLNLCFKQTKNINLQNKDGMTALMLLIKNGNYDLAQEILALNPECSTVNNNGQTAFDMAVLKNEQYVLMPSIFSNEARLAPLIEALQALAQKQNLEGSLEHASASLPGLAYKI